MYFLGDIKLQAALLLHQKIYVKIQPAVQTMRCNNVSYWCMLNPFLELLLEEDQKENLQMLLLENCSQLHLTNISINISRQKQIFSRILSFLQLQSSGISLMLIFLTRFIVRALLLHSLHHHLICFPLFCRECSDVTRNRKFWNVRPTTK